jgi:uncharacterized membrane protein YgcG
MKRAIMLFLLIFTISFVLGANCPPSLPKTYYGMVSYQESVILGDYEIRAVMGSDTFGISNVIRGGYSIDISPCSGTTGQVSFYINGIKTNENGVYSGMSDWGKSQSFNLTINQIPITNSTCGNGIIELGEECDRTNLAGRSTSNCGTGWTGTISCSSNCRIDYSNCIYSPSSGGGDSSWGGGGSSGSSSGGGSSGNNNGNTITLNTQKNKSANNTLISEENNPIKTNNNSPLTGSTILDFIKSGRGIVAISIILVLLLVTFLIVLKKRTKNV